MEGSLVKICWEKLILPSLNHKSSNSIKWIIYPRIFPDYDLNPIPHGTEVQITLDPPRAINKTWFVKEIIFENPSPQQ
jgi:hypothetical protein